jgi:hypothetical protein
MYIQLKELHEHFYLPSQQHFCTQKFFLKTLVDNHPNLKRIFQYLKVFYSNIPLVDYQLYLNNFSFFHY